jgi:hypothetical protein
MQAEERSIVVDTEVDHEVAKISPLKIVGGVKTYAEPDRFTFKVNPIQMQLGTDGSNALRAKHGVGEYGTTQHNLVLTDVKGDDLKLAQDIDASVYATWQENSRALFKKDVNREHHTIVKTDDDGAHTLTVKVTTADGEYPTILTNPEGEKVGLDHLNRDAKLIVMATLKFIWINKEQFGAVLYADKIVVKKGVREELEFKAGWDKGW